MEGTQATPELERKGDRGREEVVVVGGDELEKD